MHSDVMPLVEATGLGKTYRIFASAADRLRQSIPFTRRRHYTEFTALKDVSFTLNRGEILGVIGRNGAGKSTLMQLVAGIIRPTEGTLRVRGSVYGLLELGAGFNPDLTGLENIYFQGLIQGIDKTTVHTLIPSIIEFSELGEFIHKPVRIYSSGMFVRLAFAIALARKPDILVVDEALAVGDIAFQRKCLEKIRQMQAEGTAIIFVTHAMEQVAHYCDRALLLDRGKVLFLGDASSALDHYFRLQPAHRTPSVDAAQQIITSPTDSVPQLPGYRPDERRWGDQAASIVAIGLLQEGLEHPPELIPGVPLEIRIHACFHRDIADVVFGLTIKDGTGTAVFNTNTNEIRPPQSLDRRAQSTATAVFRFTPYLAPGRYSLSVGLASNQGNASIPHDRRYDVLNIDFAMPTDRTDGRACHTTTEIID